MKKGSEDIRSLAVRNVLAGKYSVAQVAERFLAVSSG